MALNAWPLQQGELMLLENFNDLADFAVWTRRAPAANQWVPKEIEKAMEQARMESLSQAF